MWDESYDSYYGLILEKSSVDLFNIYHIRIKTSRYVFTKSLVLIDRYNSTLFYGITHIFVLLTRYLTSHFIPLHPDPNPEVLISLLFTISGLNTLLSTFTVSTPSLSLDILFYNSIFDLLLLLEVVGSDNLNTPSL